MKFVLSVGLSSLLFIGIVFGLEALVISLFWAGAGSLKWLLIPVCLISGVISGYLASRMNLNAFFFSAMIASILSVVYWLGVYVLLGEGLGVVIPIVMVPVIGLAFAVGAGIFFIRNYKYSI